MDWYTQTFQGVTNNYGFAADFDEELDDVEAAFVSAETALGKNYRITDAVLSPLLDRNNKLLRATASGVELVTDASDVVPMTPIVLQGNTFSLNTGFSSQRISWASSRNYPPVAGELDAINNYIQISPGTWLVIISGIATLTTEPDVSNYATVSASIGSFSLSRIIDEIGDSVVDEPQPFMLCGSLRTVFGGNIEVKVVENGTMSVDINDVSVVIKRIHTG